MNLDDGIPIIKKEKHEAENYNNMQGEKVDIKFAFKGFSNMDRNAKECPDNIVAQNSFFPHFYSIKEEKEDCLLDSTEIKNEFLSADEESMDFKVNSDEKNYFNENLEVLAEFCVQNEATNLLDKTKQNCTICFELFGTATDLETHMRTKHFEVYKISLNKKENSLKKCKLEMTDQINDRTCRSCFKVFSSEKRLSFHMIKTHNNAMLIKIQQKSEKDCLQKQQPAADKATCGDTFETNIPRAACPICYLVLGSMESLHNHIKNNHKDVEIYTCKSCRRYFRTQTLLETHLIKMTKCAFDTLIRDRVSPTCAGCNLIFKRFLTLKLHLRKCHGGLELLICKSCNLRFILRSQLNFHLKNSENCSKSCKVGLMLCNGQEIDISDTVEVFLDESAINDRTCTLCNKIFQSKQALTLHMETSHTNLKPFACENCNGNFTYLEEFEQHVLEESSKCRNNEQIEELKSQKNVLSQAKRKPKPIETVKKIRQQRKKRRLFEELKTAPHPPNEEKLRTCILCNKIFNKVRRLASHMSEVHKRIKLFSCEICQRKFSLRRSLYRHFKKTPQCLNSQEIITLPEQPNEASEENANVEIANIEDIEPGEKHNFRSPEYRTCHICKKTLSTFRSLPLHLRQVHKISKTIECKKCNYEFLTKLAYHKHLLKTSCRKPTEPLKSRTCGICKQVFRSINLFLKHWQAAHKDISLYDCKICGQAFKYKKGFIDHTKKSKCFTNVEIKEEDPLEIND